MPKENCGCPESIFTPCKTNINTSSTFSYDGIPLPCIGVEPCDSLNNVLQKINTHVCSMEQAISTHSTEIQQLDTILNSIDLEIESIKQALAICCPSVSTTTTTTTVRPSCQSWNWECYVEIGVNDVDLIYTNCEGVVITIDKLIVNNNAGSICAAPNTVPYWSHPSSIGFHQISFNNINCGV